MKPYKHARNCVKRWGGIPEDYIEIHNFMDSSKAVMADARHRAALHHAFGCFIVEKAFGDFIQKPDGTIVKTTYITNSDGKKVQVRDIAEQHIQEDLGWIPTLNDYYKHMDRQAWFSFPKFFVDKLANLLRKEQENVNDVRPS